MIKLLSLDLWCQVVMYKALMYLQCKPPMSVSDNQNNSHRMMLFTKPEGQGQYLLHHNISKVNLTCARRYEGCKGLATGSKMYMYAELLQHAV